MVGRLSFPLVKDKDLSILHDQECNKTRPSTADSSNTRTNGPPASGQPMAMIASQANHSTNSSSIFSGSLWRRRASQAVATVNTGSREGKVVGDDPTERRDASSKSSTFNLNLDKDLPAVPTSVPGEEPSQVTSEHSVGISGFVATQFREEARSQRNSPPNASAPVSRKVSLVPPHSQPTLILARASLGLGLPYTMPAVASTSTNSEASFITSSASGHPAKQAKSSTSIRRAKSFTRTRTEGSLVSAPPVQLTPRTWTRGTNSEEQESSVGRRSADVKGKGKAEAPFPSSESPPIKTLARRPSFWNRRRVQSLRTPAAPMLRSTMSEGLSKVPTPTLPNLLPMSPMFPGKDSDRAPPTFIETSYLGQPRHLQRRHSDRSASLSSPISADFVQSVGLQVPTYTPTSHTSSPVQDDTPTPPTAATPLETFQEECHVEYTLAKPSSITPVSSTAHLRDPKNSARARPRSMTNPSMFLQRLSLGFFSNSSPVSPACSPSISAGVLEGSIYASPRNSDSLARSSLSKSHIEIPRPLVDEESPEAFVKRLEEVIGKGEIAGVLASSADAVYAKSLQAYIGRFDFTNDPLDVAVRRLLMNVGLPKETQQIDRVMEAFASQYSSCNPNLFSSKDHPYILAFSLIMLHTDVYNKSNKRKMSRSDYIKNASLDGVSPLILDYFFDNIIFAPFIYIEDPLEPMNQSALRLDNSPSRSRHASTNGAVTPSTNNNTMGMLGKANKIDPYYLIANNLLHPLRVDVESYIPTHDPFTYRGTTESWSECDLRLTFAHAIIVQSDTPESRRTSALPFVSLTVGGAPGPMMSTFAGLPPNIPDYDTIPPELILLKMAKFGLINRKDDVTDGGKKAATRKWKEMTMILTSSHLLFFRDPTLAADFNAQIGLTSFSVFASPTTLLKPDEMVPLKDSIALFDMSYKKRPNVFRFVVSSGKQILLQADSEDECNDWLWKINYASTFQTAGIKKRTITSSAHELQDHRDADSLDHRCVRIPLADMNTRPDDDEHKLAPTTLRNSVASQYIPTVSPSSLRASMISTETEVTSDVGTETTSLLPNGAGNTSTDRLDGKHQSSEEDHAWERYQLVRDKIEEMDKRLSILVVQLQNNMSIAKNIAVLTPFQRSTRERLSSSVTNLSKTIKQLRMEQQLISCYRDILVASLAGEERERWDHTSLAMNALSRQDMSYQPRERTLPRMTFSEHEDDAFMPGSFRSFFRMPGTKASISNGRTSSERSSPRISSSRLDNADSRNSTQLSVGNDTGDSSAYCASTSSPSIGSTSVIDVQGLPESRSDDSRPSFEGPTADTQAEEWNKTRAAKRVSLVRLPSTLGPLRLEESTQNSS